MRSPRRGVEVAVPPRRPRPRRRLRRRGRRQAQLAVAPPQPQRRRRPQPTRRRALDRLERRVAAPQPAAPTASSSATRRRSRTTTCGTVSRHGRPTGSRSLRRAPLLVEPQPPVQSQSLRRSERRRTTTRLSAAITTRGPRDAVVLPGASELVRCLDEPPIVVGELSHLGDEPFDATRLASEDLAQCRVERFLVRGRALARRDLLGPRRHVIHQFP